MILARRYAATVIAASAMPMIRMSIAFVRRVRIDRRQRMWPDDFFQVDAVGADGVAQPRRSDRCCPNMPIAPLPLLHKIGQYRACKRQEEQRNLLHHERPESREQGASALGAGSAEQVTDRCSLRTRASSSPVSSVLPLSPHSARGPAPCSPLLLPALIVPTASSPGARAPAARSPASAWTSAPAVKSTNTTA